MKKTNIINKKLLPLIQELIKNKCVNTGDPDSGQEIKSANTLKDFFSVYGIDSTILESHPGRANLLVRVPGNNPKAPSLMFMSHLDVVPACADYWSYDPFAGDISGDFIRGRGAADMLNITASSALAFAELIKKQDSFPGDLIFLALADEEASGRLGARWLVEKHWDKVETDYMITELGGFFVKTKQGTAIAITVGEKGVAWTRLKIKGETGHGSMPYHVDNAAVKIAKVVNKLAKHKPKMIICKEYKEMLDHLGLSNTKIKLLSNKKTRNKYLQKINKKSPGMAKALHAGSQMTINPTIINAGSKTNVIPDSGEIELDIRILPQHSVEDVIMEIKKALGSLFNSCNIEIMEYFPANFSPQKTPLFDATREIIGSIYPFADYIPFFMPGVTDARYWRKRGTIAYGFTLLDEKMTISEYTKMIHGIDEKISIKSLELSYNFFHRLPQVFFEKVVK